MDRCKLTVHAKDITLTERQLGDVVTGFYGHLVMLAGIDDEWKVEFADIADPDIGNLFAVTMAEGFRYAMTRFTKAAA